MARRLGPDDRAARAIAKDDTVLRSPHGLNELTCSSADREELRDHDDDQRGSEC